MELQGYNKFLKGIFFILCQKDISHEKKDFLNN